MHARTHREKPDITDSNPSLAKVIEDLGDSQILVVAYNGDPKKAETKALEVRCWFLALQMMSHVQGTKAMMRQTRSVLTILSKHLRECTC